MISDHYAIGKIFYWGCGPLHGTSQVVHHYEDKLFYINCGKYDQKKVIVTTVAKFRVDHTDSVYHSMFHDERECWMHMHDNIGKIEEIPDWVEKEVFKNVKRLENNAKRRLLNTYTPMREPDWMKFERHYNLAPKYDSQGRRTWK